MLLDGCGHGRVDQSAPPVYFRGNFHYAVIDRRKIVQNTAQFSHLLPHKISDIKLQLLKKFHVGEALVMAGCAIPHQVEGRG